MLPQEHLLSSPFSLSQRSKSLLPSGRKCPQTSSTFPWPTGMRWPRHKSHILLFFYSFPPALSVSRNSRMASAPTRLSPKTHGTSLPCAAPRELCILRLRYDSCQIHVVSKKAHTHTLRTRLYFSVLKNKTIIYSVLACHTIVSD